MCPCVLGLGCGGEMYLYCQENLPYWIIGMNYKTPGAKVQGEKWRSGHKSHEELCNLSHIKVKYSVYGLSLSQLEL